MKKSELLAKLKGHLGLKNINQAPKIEKVIVSMGIGSLVTRKWHKDFDEFERNLIRITGQKPRLVKSKRAISNFKLREWLPVMLQVTLRGNRAYDFLDRFAKLVLPRVRDFSGVSTKSFDPKANLNMGLQNYNIFPELGVDDVTLPMGIQLTIVTTGDTVEYSQALLEDIGFIFK